MASRLFVVDGHAHCYKAFYALRNLTSPDGRPVNMVYGFAAMLRKIMRQYEPEYLAIAFDTPKPTFRHAMYTEYKANRQAPPTEFIEQMPLVRELIQAHRIPVFTREGFEADDIMASLARQALAAGLDVCLVTSDKDAQQLLGPRLSMLDSSKDEWLTADGLLRDKGMMPEQVIDWLALMGDASDNVPGIPGVGPKTALKLVQDHGGLDGALKAAKAMKPSKLRDSLLAHGEEARLSRKLVVLDADVDVKLDLDACKVRPPQEETLRSLYERLGFRQFLAEMGSAPTREETRYRLVDTPEAFKRFLADLGRQKAFSLDTETTSTNPVAADLVGLSFCWKDAEAYYLPVRGPLAAAVLPLRETLDALRPVIENPRVGKVGQNIKYDAVVLRTHGVRLHGIAFDTMLAAYLLDPERRRFNLDDLSLQFLNHRCIPITDLIGKGAKQITMDQVEVARVCEYSCEDADMAWRLFHVLEPKVREAGLEDLYRMIELPVLDVLVDMEAQGVRLNAADLKEMSEWLARRIAELEKDIYRAAGVEFNISSPKQLAAVLFDTLGLPKVRRTRTGASTDAEVLEALADMHPAPRLVLEHRSLVKLKGTYVDALPQMILARTGRIHTSFSQTAATTGRLASSEPNLQNIPIRTELGNRIRRAFVPSEDGWLLMSADYSQIELRILAHLSGDAALIAAFQDDQDIHRFVASQVYGVRPDDVTPEQRRAAKAVNFGIVYGLTPYGLSRDIGVPVRDAEAFIEAYFCRHPGVRRFIDETIHAARRDGRVETLKGRRRPLPDIQSSDANRRAFAERAAVNTVVQGSAADMMKLAMIRLRAACAEAGLKARLLLQIHDELLLEFPPKEERRLRAVVTEAMENAMPLKVPVRVQTAVGANWLEAK